MPPIHDNPFGPCAPTVLREPIDRLRAGRDLSQDQAHAAFTLIMQGSCPDVEIAENLKKKKIKSEFAPNEDQKRLEELLNFSNRKLSKLYLNHVDKH